MSRVPTRLISGFVLLLLSTFSSAAPSFFARTTAETSQGGIFSMETDGAASARSVASSEEAEALAAAGGGFLRASSFSRALPNPAGSSARALASSSMFLDDIVFAYVAGAPPPTRITPSLRLLVSGSVSAAVFGEDPSGFGSSSAGGGGLFNGRVWQFVGGILNPLASFEGSIVGGGSFPGPISFGSDDMLRGSLVEGVTIDGLPIGSVGAILNIPLVVDLIEGTGALRLSLGLGVGSNARGDALARSRFSDTLSFLPAALGPVFSGLPEGVTVNSAGGNIVDNAFMLPGQSVPEPGTLFLLCSAMLGAVLVRRRRFR